MSCILQFLKPLAGLNLYNCCPSLEQRGCIAISTRYHNYGWRFPLFTSFQFIDHERPRGTSRQVILLMSTIGRKVVWTLFSTAYYYVAWDAAIVITIDTSRYISLISLKLNRKTLHCLTHMTSVIYLHISVFVQLCIN